jgi:hypothetical protein
MELINNSKIRVGFFSILFVMTLLNTCSNGGNRKAIIKLQKKIDSLTVEVSKRPTQEQYNKSLQIEGLKAEKRMIQSTDRKIMDLQRQVEIDKELKELQGK